jgi:hypothetical protein
MLVLGAGVSLAALVGLYYWHATGAAIAAIAATIIAAFQVFQSFLPSPTKVDEAAERLSGLVEDNWGTWRRQLLGQASPADVEFARNDDLRLGEAHSASENGQLTAVHSFYEGLDPARLVVLGAAGSGKTMLAVELALQLLRLGFRDRQQGPPQVAVPISVAGWTGEQSLRDWLADRLSEAYHLPPGVAAQLVEARRILPVLDGLDEIAQDPGRGRSTVERVLSALNTADRGTRLTPIVVTCRDSFYQDLYQKGLGIRDATVVNIEKLTADRISAYIARRFLADSSSRAHHRDWQQLHREIEQGGAPALVAAFELPWLMTLAATVCDSGLATLRELQSRDQAQLRDFLVDEFISATVVLQPKSINRRRLGEPQLSEEYRHAAAADRYDAGVVTERLTVLAGHLRWQSEHQMSPTDLQPDRLWLIAAVAGKPVRAVHTAISVALGLLMGALAAEFTGGIPGVITTCLMMALGAGFGLRAGLWEEMPSSRGHTPRILAGWPLTGVTAWFLTAPSPSRVNIWRALNTPKWACLVAAAGITGAVAGSLDGGIKVGVTEALAASLAACILTGLSYGTSYAVAPEEPLRNDLIFGLALGAVAGIATGLPGGLTGGLAASIHLNAYLTVPGSALVAITISLLAGLALGARAWLRYTIALAFAASERTLPWNCLRFLDWAATAGLLRTSGIDYQFRHDDLRKHLGTHV